MKWRIKNSNNEEICVKLSALNNIEENKLALVCHGITGYKEQEVILQTVSSLQALGYNVLSFDCRNSRGESFNNQKCATLTDFCADLKTVINWAKTQSFYKSPFLLVGHSLGGAAILDYALDFPNQVDSLILISAIFSGEDLLNNTHKFNPEFLQSLKTDGIIRSREGRNCYLDMAYLQDAQQYNFYRRIGILNRPVLLITGDKDTASLPENNQNFFERVKAYKELHILKNCSHIYETKDNQADLDNVISAFVSKLASR